MSKRVVTIEVQSSNRICLHFPIIDIGSINLSLVPIVPNSIDTMGLTDLFEDLVPGEESIYSIIASIPESIPSGSVFPVSSGLYSTGEIWEASDDYTLQRISFLPGISGGNWQWNLFHLVNQACLYLYIYYDIEMSIPVSPSDEGVLGHFSSIPPNWIKSLPDGGVFCSPCEPFSLWAASGPCIFNLREGYGADAGLYEWSMLLGMGDIICTPSDRANYPKHFLNNGYAPSGYNIAYEMQNAYWQPGSIQDEVTAYPLSDLRDTISNLRIKTTDSGSVTTTSYHLVYLSAPTGSPSAFSYPTILNTSPFDGVCRGAKGTSIPGVLGGLGLADVGILRRLRKA